VTIAKRPADAGRHEPQTLTPTLSRKREREKECSATRLLQQPARSAHTKSRSKLAVRVKLSRAVVPNEFGSDSSVFDLTLLHFA
jgi:hypothetical protein